MIIFRLTSTENCNFKSFIRTGTKMLQVNLHMATNSDVLVNSQVKITVQWKTSHRTGLQWLLSKATHKCLHTYHRIIFS